MADQYSPHERDQQVAAVVALREQGWSLQRIADHLGIAKATAHDRSRQGALAVDKAAVGEANVVRRAATHDLMRWAEENRDAFERSDRAVIDAHRATLSAVRIWEALARMWGANLPVRVSIGAEPASGPVPDEAMTAAVHAALADLQEREPKQAVGPADGT